MLESRLQDGRLELIVQGVVQGRLPGLDSIINIWSAHHGLFFGLPPYAHLVTRHSPQGHVHA